MAANTQLSRLRQLAKDLHLGVALYRLYYAPKGYIEKLLRWGLINTVLTNRGRLKMEKAVSSLKPIQLELSNNLPNSPEIYFLTGKKYWYQTCFCAYSMIQQSPTHLRPVIYDDGTLEQKHKEEIMRIFPSAKIVSLETIEARLDKYLPESKFPVLRERRLKQPLLRKLTDFHVGSQGWKLFLDSDMLFFQSPKFLLEWLNYPQKPCYMMDVKNAYGYSNDLMVCLSGNQIPELVNIGILGFKSEDIDWQKLELWLKTMLEKEGTHYNVTQGLSAMLLAGKPCAIAPAEEYLLMPEREEALKPQAVMHHYVADSKPWYFRYGWRHVLRSSK
jgi:hypothetical protein